MSKPDTGEWKEKKTQFSGHFFDVDTFGQSGWRICDFSSSFAGYQSDDVILVENHSRRTHYDLFPLHWLSCREIVKTMPAMIF